MKEDIRMLISSDKLNKEKGNKIMSENSENDFFLTSKK